MKLGVLFGLIRMLMGFWGRFFVNDGYMKYKYLVYFMFDFLGSIYVVSIFDILTMYKSTCKEHPKKGVCC